MLKKYEIVIMLVGVCGVIFHWKDVRQKDIRFLAVAFSMMNKDHYS